MFQKFCGFSRNCLCGGSVDERNAFETVLVEGSTRIPKVQQIIREFFTVKELNRSFNSDKAVVFDTVVQTAILTGENSSQVQDL